MRKQPYIIIIGGGLAGLTAAIHLSKRGLRVILIEKNSFPKHKVCGEYISNEVLTYFDWLEININELNPSHLNKFQFSSQNGKIVNSLLPLGGIGISRYALDNFLQKKALENGCEIIHDSVEDIVFSENQFTVTTLGNKSFNSEIVIGAHGKRSNVDQKLNRDFISKKTPWLAVKSHYSGDFPDDLVGLYHFKGGYCGVSKVEDNKINICYLADYKTFKQYKNIEEYQNNVLSKNPQLKAIFDYCKPLFEKPLTISQISFGKKKTVENHVLMIGDTAGLIHPLCGNGMAMAVHSAKIVSGLIEDYLNGVIKTRKKLERKYHRQWKKLFYKRLIMGRMLSSVLAKEKLSYLLMSIVVKIPFLLQFIIKNTHGNPIKIS